jgi:predicted O-methyltransferase YrrM
MCLIVFVPKRVHLAMLRNLSVNLARVTRNPVSGYRGLKIGWLIRKTGAQQKLSEVAPFLALVGHPSTIVEIGAGRGGMLALFCAVASDDATIVSVDLEAGPFGEGVSDAELRSRAAAKPNQKLHLVRGNSRDPHIVEQVSTLTPNGIELLFVDGDHTYEGVSEDYRLYSPLVSPGAIIAFHDILPHTTSPECQVDLFWREQAGWEKREIVSADELFDDGGTWGGIGILVTPPSSMPAAD